MKPPIPLLNTFLAATFLMKENHECILTNIPPNPHTPEIHYESSLSFPCAAPLSGVQTYMARNDLFV